MSEKPTSPAETASARQHKASAPGLSAWVSANAGSGKTRVLADRVVRLLLDGTPPERILCLTFTKAAAAEMAARIFDTLGRWVQLDDEALIEAIYDVEGRGRFGPDRLARARRLFAQALETPGGLKIQTIHAFCESLLHRFPLEADVPAGFTVLDDHLRADALADARARVLNDAAQAENRLADHLRTIVRHVQANEFDDLLDQILARRGALAEAHSHYGGVDGIGRALRRVHEIPDGLAPEQVIAEAFDDFPAAEFSTAVQALGAESKKDQEFAARLHLVLNGPDDNTRFAALLDAFLTQKRTIRESPVTKGAQANHPDLLAWVEGWQARVCALLERYRAATLCTASEALLAIASLIVERYEADKRARGFLDYDDLIARTVDLLDGTTSAWVLYRLDGGLDHILVDEAQDTSPGQWRVVERLSAEFFAGEGAREDIVRTVFAVGDEKQSIFSFQGADPAKFEEMRRYFRIRAVQAGHGFEDVPLTVSFRSTSAVLRAVDTVFQGPAGDGLSDGDIQPHVAYRERQPGLVEIWPTFKPDDAPERRAWDDPVDAEAPGSASRRLAARIAATISGWLEDEELLTARDRPIRPGDILILVRRRSAFADAMVAELKRRGVPVAGADRLRLTGHIAVQDLISLGRFALQTHDDLALAEVLKSPLVARADGTPIDDHDLTSFAHKRPGTLWTAFRSHAKHDPVFAPAAETIAAWLNLAGWQRPFEFYSAVLNGTLPRAGARKGLAARLGGEIHDPVDEFLSAALAHERDGPPSLEAFLDAVSRADTDIRRDMEHGKDEVRIMTVHGAKGLEAGVVFLADTCSVPDHSHEPRIMMLDDPQGTEGAAQGVLPAWRVGSDFETAPVAQARLAQRTRMRQEYNRLLYVAMTRASDRLYVCGYETKRGRPAGCWYDLIHAALAQDCSERRDADGNPVALRLVDEDADAVAPDGGSGAAVAEPTPPPAWARTAPAPEAPATVTLAPSRLAPDADRPETIAADLEQPVLSPLAGSDRDRFARGRLIHTLLQRLPDVPADARRKRAKAYLARPGHGLAVEQIDEILDATFGVLDDPDTAWLFGEGTLAEVAVAATLPLRDAQDREVAISGQVDRLAVRDDEVMIVDYKTNRPAADDVADVHPAYLRQMAAYRLALGRIYPGRTVRAALLWTDGPRFMELPPDALDAAFSGDRASSDIHN